MKSDGNMTDQIERLLSGHLRDPHALLGAHPRGSSTIVRAWRPEAQTVQVLVDGAVTAKLERVHPAGLFEGTVDGTLDDYELEVGYAEGKTFAIRDPYSFPPTLGELDLHLAGEGSHRRLFEKLGAHSRTERGIAGVSFAIWAPNARSVRVIGEFNS